MDLVGTLIGSALFPGVGFYTTTELSCRQACCDMPDCDSYAYAAGTIGYVYPLPVWTSASPSATITPSPTNSAPCPPAGLPGCPFELCQIGLCGGGSGGAAGSSAGGYVSAGFAAQCYLFNNVSALVPNNLMMSAVLISKYS